MHEEKGLTWSATAYARFNRDAVTEITRALSDTVKLSTKVNLPKDRAAGLEFSAAGKLTPQLGYSLSGNAFWSEIEAGSLVPGVSRST